MEENIFADCLEHWKKSDGYSKFWPYLAEKYGYRGGEELRDKFKKERKRRGITKETLIAKKSETGTAKVIVFDIEVAPLVCYTFDIWNQNIGVDQIISQSFVLSWSAKMLNETKIYSDVLTSEEAINQDDLRVVKSLWELLNSCQILIGQNIKGFDIKKLNTRLLKFNLPPLVKHQIIDTYLVAKENFAFPSNSLKGMNKYLGIRDKQDTEGFGLWAKCMKGDMDALRAMDEYCQGDVLATEDLYFKVRPFIRSHPNLALFFDDCDERCPNCGSDNLKNEGFYYTPAGKWESMRCENCGAVSRSKQNELSKEKKRSLKVN